MLRSLSVVGLNPTVTPVAAFNLRLIGSRLGLSPGSDALSGKWTNANAGQECINIISEGRSKVNKEAAVKLSRQSRQGGIWGPRGAWLHSDPGHTGNNANNPAVPPSWKIITHVISHTHHRLIRQDKNVLHWSAGESHSLSSLLLFFFTFFRLFPSSLFSQSLLASFHFSSPLYLFYFVRPISSCPPPPTFSFLNLMIDFLFLLPLLFSSLYFLSSPFIQHS